MGYRWINPGRIRDVSGVGGIARWDPDADSFVESYPIVIILYLLSSEGRKEINY